MMTIYSGDAIQLLPLDEGFIELNLDATRASVNIFNAAAVAELNAALDILETKKDVRGLLITSAKNSFVAGADIDEFLPLFRSGKTAIQTEIAKNNRNYNRLEDLRMPVVAAINGAALGGGFELCLACDYRIANTAGQIGFPECSLGILPGWGGTVRFPRLAGIDTAIEWIALAQIFDPATGLKAGVLDAVVAPEKLREAALHTLRQCSAGKLDYKERRRRKQAPLRHNAIELTLAVESARGMALAKIGPNYPAPLAAIDAMQKAAGLDRNAALRVEAEAFAELAGSDPARALVGIFLNDQAVAKKAKDWIKQADKINERAAVIGAGIMGGGIALQSAMQGVPIIMKDIAQAGLDLGFTEINKHLAKRVERGGMTPAKMGQALISITPALSFNGFKGVDIVVEAVVENPKVKQTVLAEVERELAEHAILTSNTSTISISFLSQSLKRPENFCGMHFFNPVHAMPLVEVIRGKRTSDRAIARTVAFAHALGKKPVVVNDCPGFLVNRVLNPYFFAFLMLVRDGADFQQVDRVMEHWGWPMGPAYLIDVIGIDTIVHSEPVMARGYPDRMTLFENAATDVLCRAGRLGQKNGQGFYDYQPDQRGRPRKQPSVATAELLERHVARRQEFSKEEIIARMLIPMATEMARCLEEGIVASAAEADAALIHGLGFPRFRGGICRWMDTVGLKAVCETADRYVSLGGLYRIPEGLRRLAADGVSHYAI